MSEQLASYSGSQVRIGRANTMFLNVLFGLLTGYATIGRGFAYLGFPPLYVGELTLLLGGAVLLRTGLLWSLLNDRVFICIAVFMAWGFYRTLPGVGTYGILAIRDAMIWGYAIFAFLVASALMSDISQPARLLRFFQRFALIIAFALPPLFVLSEFAASVIPNVPGTDVSLLVFKSGDALVHIAGILVLVLSGLVELTSLQSALLLALSLVLVARARSGLAGLLAAGSLPAILSPVRRYLIGGAIALLVLLASAAFLDIKVQLTDRREFSANQIISGVQSAVNVLSNPNWSSLAQRYASSDRLNGSVIWRVVWWSYLVQKVQMDFPMTGLGFGESLALPGVPVAIGENVRSPHNGNMTIYARMGLIGFVLWLIALGVWLHAMLQSHLRAKRTGHPVWAALFMVFPAYVLASWLNGSFDVYLEGPMGGIWFWTLIGAGAAMRRWFQEMPDYWERLVLVDRSRLSDG